MSKDKSDDQSTGKEEDMSAYRINDPAELARNMIRLFEESGKVFSGMAERTNDQGGTL